MTFRSRRRYWTDADVAILRREYPERYAHEVAAMLDVSARRIYVKAAALKLGKSAAYWAHEKARLRERGKARPAAGHG
ncbi:MAG: hypothetical protein IT531_00270 [Burkholderiales bacterium]|nr:hypothetical protein [Burkholderiales bacterium]